MLQKYSDTTVKLGTISEKSRRRSVIFKIVVATTQLDQNFKPTRNLPGQFFIYI